MANPTGFMQYPRVEVEHRPIEQRIRDWYEVDRRLVVAFSTSRRRVAWTAAFRTATASAAR